MEISYYARRWLLAFGPATRFHFDMTRPESSLVSIGACLLIQARLLDSTPTGYFSRIMNIGVCRSPGHDMQDNDAP